VVSACRVYSVDSHGVLCLSLVMGKNFCTFFFALHPSPAHPRTLEYPMCSQFSEPGEYNKISGCWVPLISAGWDRLGKVERGW
jgi:hypothetical protein